MPHLRANVNHDSSVCFKHFDNEEKMFKWISQRIGKEVHSYEECEEWSRHQEYGDNPKNWIEVLYFDDVKEFYTMRQDYLNNLRQLDDAIAKAQRLPKCLKRDILLKRINMRYEDAFRCIDQEPAIWYGEV